MLQETRQFKIRWDTVSPLRTIVSTLSPFNTPSNQYSQYQYLMPDISTLLFRGEFVTFPKTLVSLKGPYQSMPLYWLLTPLLAMLPGALQIIRQSRSILHGLQCLRVRKTREFCSFLLLALVVELIVVRPCTSSGPRMLFHDDPQIEMLASSIPLEIDGL